MIKMINVDKKEFLTITRTAFQRWQKQNSALRAAALTFFIILPLPSLLLIIIAIFSQFYGQEQALQALLQQITAVAGPSVAGLIGDLLSSARSPLTSILASVTTIAFTIGGAVGAFGVLHDTLNSIWEVPSIIRRNFYESLKKKIVPLLIISALGVLVIVWTAVSTVFFQLARFLLEPLTGGFTSLIINASQLVLSFVLASVLFAVIYKDLPDIHVKWQDVLIAAVLVAFAFTLTNALFGFFIQTFTVTSVIGAAGSLMILLLWIFILNQYVLFGAQFAAVYAKTKGSLAQRPLMYESTVIPHMPEKPPPIPNQEIGQPNAFWSLAEAAADKISYIVHKSPIDVEVDVKFRLVNDEKKKKKII